MAIGPTSIIPTALPRLLPGIRALVPAVRALRVAAARELAAEQDRWGLWLPFGLASGIAAYFALPAEPPLWSAAAAAMAALACAIAGRRVAGVTPRSVLVISCVVALGFAAAVARTGRADAPIIAREIGPVWIEGRVESVSEHKKGVRILLVPTSIRGLGADSLPRRVRISFRKPSEDLYPGAWIAALAVLLPPPGPSVPGGYDFARWAFFEGIGGVGYVYGAPRGIAAPRAATFSESVWTRVEQLRAQIGVRIRAVLPGTEGAIATALITGDRGGIPESDNDAFRDSGLVHVLSISGLHMTLAGLGLFWIARALLALSPRLALAYPIKKWAVFAALAGATFYLAISGWAAPTVRSFIMLSVMLLGVLADRPALSMRSVAIAAVVILLVEPESLVEPGFQMSFAAVAGLIALAEWERTARLARGEPPSRSPLAMARRYMTGLALTSLVAGLATAPFAVFHFNRAAHYAILANLAAMPIVAAIIMPMAALGVVLMPFGLEAWPLRAMGWGIEAMLAVAHTVSALPGAYAIVPSIPLPALILMVGGGAWLALWQRRWRWVGGVPIAVGLALTMLARPPDLFVSRDGATLAMRTGSGVLEFFPAKIDDFAAETWLRRDGDARDIADAANGNTVRCDAMGCVGVARTGRIVAAARTYAALEADCARADIVIAQVPLRGPCPNPVLTIDRFDLWRGGAHVIWFGDAGSITVETAEAARGRRPWTGAGAQ